MLPLPTISRSPRHWLIATACAIAAAASPAGAQMADFNSLTVPPGEGTLYIGNCYMEAQLTFTALGLGCDVEDAFAVFGPDETIAYTGSSTLTMAQVSGVDITAWGGRSFTLRSVGLAPGGGAFGFPTTVMFTGLLYDGGTVTQTVEVPGPDGTTFSGVLTPFTLSGFTNVRSVTVLASGDDPFVQLDNVSASVVPEPATVTLVALGLGVMLVIGRRRRFSL